jgi:hypothetical protein
LIETVPSIPVVAEKESDETHDKAVVEIKDVKIHVDGPSSALTATELAENLPSRKSSSSSSTSSKKSDHAAEASETNVLEQNED